MAEDELEPLISECPNCRTRFRVTETQLQVASGRVRCGACLTVFHGVDHLLWDGRDALGSDAQAEDVLDEVLEELTDPKAARVKPAHSERTRAEESKADAEAEGWSDSTALYLGGREPEETDFDPMDGVDEPSDERLDVGKDEEDLLAVPDPPVDATDHRGWDDAAWKVVETYVDSDSADDTDDDDGDITGDVGDDRDNDNTDDRVDEIDNDNDDRIERAETDAGAEPESAPVPQSGAAEGANLIARPTTGATAPVARLPDPEEALDPVLREEISFAPEPRRWWVPIAAVFGILALLLQVFWYQFESWSRDPVLRPLYSIACATLACELPAMQDLKKMRTRNLIVRSHPELTRALIVDAVIVNDWDYPQSFPELELTFKSLNGELVAGRRFQPSEYLSGELSGKTEMPPRTPVRIELEIEDPGPEAVNYFLSFR